MASFAFQGPRAGLQGHSSTRLVSVPVGLALFSFLTQTAVLAGTYPPNRARSVTDLPRPWVPSKQ
jgi:hypothetical protein